MGIKFRRRISRYRNQISNTSGGLLNNVSSVIETIYKDAKSGGETIYTDVKQAGSFYGDQVDKLTDLPKQALETGKELVKHTEDTLFSPFTLLEIQN